MRNYLPSGWHFRQSYHTYIPNRHKGDGSDCDNKHTYGLTIIIIVIIIIKLRREEFFSEHMLAV